ncbi:hypothetical protein IVB69_02645 [Flavobacterium sp. J49]|uniref:hypothetical protein n=1 Tax=Flavobacterium sp. J49 TaxID=2718534 RepID=UPI0015948724|nr:hypothetical protein [Flavobacterium sp. J49]MBF6640372.1 hypothetical protein [Flavobacterium sp. J49]NIC01617.1 hypothetical protein [Flavobacterium sp. J49]
MKKIMLCLILLMSLASSAQSVNDYQFVIVPKRFDSFKEDDKHGLNTSVKLLLQKYGFKAYFSDDSFFDTNVGNRCDFLTADLINESGLFVTKIRIALKDCKGNVVYQTEIGSSREKQYSIAYSQALRAAAKSFETLNYKYNGSVAVEPAAEPKPVVKVIDSKIDTVPVTTNEVFFFAQPTANGYQVIDNEPKVIMRLYNTSQKNVFMADKNGVNGTVLIKEGKWVFEYYDNGKLVSEPINLKF